MTKIPARFNRVAAVGGGGKETTVNLSALVNSYLEREIWEKRSTDDWKDLFADEADDRAVKSDIESRDLLESLFKGQNDAVRRKIYAEVEKALTEIGGGNDSPGFNRRLVALLRGRGLDAGICISKCEKDGHRWSADHEYVDVNAAGNRYVVEVLLAGKFTIARPTSVYASLLELFPPIFVGKPDELRQVVKTMCAAIRKSMKRVGFLVPPWRRLAYVQSKWFGRHTRTNNETACWNVGEDSSREYKLHINFAPTEKGRPLNCRYVFASVAGGRTGNLSAILNL